MKITAAVLLFCTAPIAAVAQTSSAAAQKPSSAQAQSAAPLKDADAAAKLAPIDPAKDAAIRRLFEAQGTRDSMKQVLASMSGNMKPMLESSLPAGEYRTQLIELFLQKFQSKLSVDRLMELAVPVYDKHFSLEDIEGLTKFYQTPLGKKAVSVLPQVILEAQSAGMKLGEQVGRESMEEVLDEHPDLKKSLENASSAPKNP